MNEEVKMYMDEAKEQMQNALVHLENELAKIRAGKANPKILNDVLVDYYGSPVTACRSVKDCFKRQSREELPQIAR